MCATPDPSTATISCRQVVAVGSGVNVRTNVHPAPTSERERQRENDNNRTMQPFLSFGVIVGYPVVLSYALVFTCVLHPPACHQIVFSLCRLARGSVERTSPHPYPTPNQGNLRCLAFKLSVSRRMKASPGISFLWGLGVGGGRARPSPPLTSCLAIPDGNRCARFNHQACNTKQ